MIHNKAQAGNYAMTFMLAVCVVILGLAFAHPLNEITNSARNETFNGGESGSGMNCSSGLIDDFTNAGCLVIDIGQGYFIIGLLGLAGIIIAARVVFR